MCICVGVPSLHADFDWSSLLRDDAEIPYCQGDECGIEEGVDLMKDNVEDIEKERTASQFIQDVVSNLISFLGVVGVIFIIYAGYLILTGVGEEEAQKKGRNIIMWVVVGFIIIYLADAIFRLVVEDILGEPETGTGTTWEIIPRAYADTVPTQATFDTYREEIAILAQKMVSESEDSGISRTSLTKLKTLIDKSARALSDDHARLYNKGLIEKLVGKIQSLEKKLGNRAAEREVITALATYMTEVRLQQIK